jgi:hypothetical protein
MVGKTIVINIAEDFTDAPGGRFRTDGLCSGEEFREMYLEPAMLRNDDTVKVILDGVFGLPTGFLEEAFGGLSRKHGAAEVLRKITFVSNEDPYLPDQIRRYINEASLSSTETAKEIK